MTLSREGFLTLASGNKLLYVELINKILLYTTESYIQYAVINHTGKEKQKQKPVIQEKDPVWEQVSGS